MARKTDTVGYHVEVTVDNWCHPEEMDMELEMCEVLLEEIRRHCDHLKAATIEKETEDVCEFCGVPWTEKDVAYNGGCCDKDEASNPDKAKP